MGPSKTSYKREIYIDIGLPHERRIIENIQPNFAKELEKDEQNPKSSEGRNY